jgi:DNA-binding NtrC family response regulator
VRKQSATERTYPGSAIDTTEVLHVLCVSPLEEDHLSLQALIGSPTCELIKAYDLVSALAMLRRRDIAVVLCERDLPPGSYRNVLEHINMRPNAPSMIVASRLADEQLWAEALNLGAWDVLATPYDGSELIRSVASGWRHWQGLHLPEKALKAAATN